MNTENTLVLDKSQLRKAMWHLSLPTMVGYALQSVYDMVDLVWVGRISSEAVAGVTIFSMLFWIGTVLNEVMNTSGISMISQSYGRKHPENTRKLIEQSITGKILISLVAGVMIALLLWLLLPHFSTAPGVTRAAKSYGIIRILFIPFLFGSYSVNTALRSIGHARSPMVLMLITSVLNLLLDPVFMFDTVPLIGIRGLGLGVAGAAIATAVSTMVAFIIGLYLLVSGRSNEKITLKGMLRFDLPIFQRFFRVGLPAAAENLFRNLLSLLLIRFVAMYGTDAITTAGIGTRLFGFAYVPIYGGFMAGSTIIAQLLGSEHSHMTRYVARLSARLSFLGIAVLSLFAALFPAQLMNVFIDDPTVIQMGIPMIRTLIPALLMGAVSMGYATVFIGSGYNRPFLISSVIARWGVQLPMLFITTIIMDWPLNLVWFSFVVAGAVELILIMIPYKKGHWLEIRV